MRLDPGRRIGAYEIVGPLGSGGMGDVYRARDTRLGRPVAIKLVSGDIGSDRAAHDRLEREARLTSSLNHPNIVTVYDVGDVDGQPFIVMELVSGETLHARMATGRLKPEEVVGIAVQLAEGLAAAHGAGVVHRDLKPRNVMLTEDGRAKILDFGLGKLAIAAAHPNDPTMRSPDLTDSHAVVGTAGYMSPEQVTGGRIDNRTDQFALGAILYEMLSGERAFKRATAIQTMAAVVDDDPTPLATLCPTAPVELATIIERCLEKDPARRYASTLDLARDLEDARVAFTSGPRSSSRSRPRPLPKSVDSKARLRRAAVPLGVALAVLLAAWLYFGTGGGGTALDEARALLYRWDEPGNVDRAAELVAARVAATPADPLAHTLLAEAYVRQYELQPDRAKDASLIDRAGIEIATALRQANLAPAHVVQAMIDNVQRRPQAAIEATDRALAVNNRSSEAYRERGRAYFFLAKTDMAETELARAIALDPDDWAAHHYLGVVYYGSRRTEEAADEFKRALELAPAFRTAATNLGGILVALGQHDEAIGVLSTAGERCQCATAYSNLGTVYYTLDRHLEAVEAHEQAVRMSDATSDHWRNLAAASHWVPGMEGRSTEAYRRAVALGEQELLFDRKNQRLLAGLADAYAVLDRDAEASALLGELQQLGPSDRNVLYQIGSVYEQLGDRGRALEWLDKAFAAGKPREDAIRSPWLRDLVKDPRFVNRVK